MNTAIGMLTGFLLAAPPAEIESAAMPRLEKGLEIIWRGRWNEAVLFPTKSFRDYEFEIRALVIDVCEQGSDVGVLTTLRYQPEVKGKPGESLPILRLETMRVDRRGNAALLPAAMLNQPAEKRESIPFAIQNLQGLPSQEAGMFLALPEGKLQLRHSWDISEENRPPMSWKLDSVAFIKAARCIKVVGQQQTTDFERLAITRTQWRRSDAVWISDRTGYAMKVERNIEKRTPESGDISFRSKLVYEQTGQLKYRDQLFEEQKAEIVKAAIFAAELQQLLNDERKADPQAFKRILKQIEQHEQTHLRGEYVPYRDAITSVKRRVHAAMNGHIPPALPPAETVEPASLVVGSPVPDFVTTELCQNRQVRLANLTGKPVVLLYYQPSGKGAEPVLKLAQNLFTAVARNAYIMGVAVGDPVDAMQQHEEGKFTMPILAGKAVYKLHGVTSTPEIVILDDRGVVRKVFVGWTDETDAAVRAELDKWVK